MDFATNARARGRIGFILTSFNGKDEGTGAVRVGLGGREGSDQVVGDLDSRRGGHFEKVLPTVDCKNERAKGDKGKKR
jgi:hypothetical protein